MSIVHAIILAIIEGITEFLADIVNRTYDYWFIVTWNC
jgi:hypothetical protein